MSAEFLQYPYNVSSCPGDADDSVEFTPTLEQSRPQCLQCHIQYGTTRDLRFQMMHVLFLPYGDPESTPQTPRLVLQLRTNTYLPPILRSANT